MKELGLLLTFLVLPFSFSYAQQKDSEDVLISVLTCSPGEALYSIYGHNAIRIYDRNSGIDVVYNYGTFDFNTPGFALKFMRGKLPYLLSTAGYADFLREYEYFKRDVDEQLLNLDSIEKQKIIQFLAINMLPENRAYKYDFFKDNCATRLRDIISANIIGVKWDESKSSGKTFRQIIKEYQQNMPWTNFGIDLIIGAPADKVTTLQDEAFIPDYLSNAIQNAAITTPSSKKLVASSFSVLSFDKDKSISFPFYLSPWFLFLILLLIELNFLFRFLAKKMSPWMAKYDKVWLVLISISSLLMIFMWFGTDHIPTKNNYNLLWCNPLLVVFWWKKAKEKKTFVKWFFLLLSGLLFISFVNAIPGIYLLPQYFHPIVLLIASILMLKLYRWYLSA